MNARLALANLLEEMSEERVARVMDFARFLANEEERRGWDRFGQSQLARAYGDDEPEYSEADLKPGSES